MADEETERTTMIWPKALKAAVQDRVGKRGLTAFVIEAVNAKLAAEKGPDAQPDNQPEPEASAERQDVDSNVTDIGTRLGSSDEHKLVAVEIVHPNADVLPDLEAVSLHCLCGESFAGAGRDGAATKKARAGFDLHRAEPLNAKEIGAAAWFRDDPTFDTPGDDRLQELRDLHTLAASTKVTVTGADGVTRDVGPATVETTKREPAPIHIPDPLDGKADPNRAYSAQITEKIMNARGGATVTDLKERFSMQTASEIEPPAVEPEPPDVTDIVPGDLTVPGDLHFETETEAAPTADDATEEVATPPTSGMCPTCFSPMIDGTCWSCSM